MRYINNYTQLPLMLTVSLTPRMLMDLTEGIRARGIKKITPSKANRGNQISWGLIGYVRADPHEAVGITTAQSIGEPVLR